MLLITHATIITPEQILYDAALLARDGKIQSIIPNSAPLPTLGANDLIVDAFELILAPGFIELQINGGYGADFTEDPATIWKVATELPHYGVTSFLPTIITSPLERVQQAINIWKSGAPVNFKGATPLGWHVEGPFLNPKKKGAHNPAYILAPDLQIIIDWSPQNGIRLVTLAPEIPGALELVQQLRQNGVIISAGHSMASYEEAQAGFLAGITYGTHLFNAMPPLEHRSPGLAGALLTSPDISLGVIADGIHTHPAIINLVWNTKGKNHLTLVTDAMAALGKLPGQYLLGDYDVTVDATTARLKDGTLAGSILTSDKALCNLMHFTGCSLYDALPTLTSTPARLLGLSQKGQIGAGKDADLVLLSPQGEVNKTIVNGEIIYSA